MDSNASPQLRFSSATGSQIQSQKGANDPNANKPPKIAIESLVRAASEVSWDSHSNFDEDFNRLLSDYNNNPNLLELYMKQRAIGSTFCATCSGTDVDLFSLLHVWTNRKASQRSATISNPGQSHTYEDINYDRKPIHVGDMVIFYHQQYCNSWQTELANIDRSKPMFELLPQKNVLLHLVDPKTTSLVMLSFIYKLANVTFIGLHNEPEPGDLPAPFFGLTLSNSKEAFFEALNIIQKQLKQTTDAKQTSYDYRLEMSYIITELDDIYTFILISDRCFKNYTEPMLLKMHSNWTLGMLSIFMFKYRMRQKYKDMDIETFLKRVNHVIQLICKLLPQLKTPRPSVKSSTGDTASFGRMALCCIVYSYLYALLSIPLNFLPWETVQPSETESCTCRSTQRQPQEFILTSFPSINEDVDIQPTHSGDATDFGNVFSQDFGAIAADAACIENTRRREVLMAHVIGMLSQDEHNWIKRSEKFVDVIDNYKLNLSWYRRPVFSNTLESQSQTWSLALAWNHMLLSACGRAWFTWYCNSIQAWSCARLWDSPGSLPPIDQQKQEEHGTCIRCLKRIVSLRVRDVVDFILDLELELKRAIRRGL